MNIINKQIELKEIKRKQKEDLDILSEHIKALGKAFEEHKNRLLINSMTTFVATDLSEMFKNCKHLTSISSDDIHPKTIERI